jgi:hypothetical protein
MFGQKAEFMNLSVHRLLHVAPTYGPINPLLHEVAIFCSAGLPKARGFNEADTVTCDLKMQ